MNRAEEEEERKRIITSFFNYAECPIKEWLAEYLCEDVNDVFTDFTDDSDMIGFEVDGKFYNAYLVTDDCESSSYVDEKLLKSKEQVAKACSKLFDAVKMVMPAVIQTCNEKYAERLKGLFYNFDNDKVAFSLAVINVPEYKKMMAAKQYRMILETKGKLQNMYDEYKAAGKFDIPPNPEDPVDPHKVIEQLKNIDETMEKTQKLFDSISADEIQTESVRCESISKTLGTANKLFMVVEETDETDADVIEEGLKRLPDIGPKYEDPDEPTLTEMLKKEYDLRE
jgi:hypothetical protein